MTMCRLFVAVGATMAEKRSHSDTKEDRAPEDGKRPKSVLITLEREAESETQEQTFLNLFSYKSKDLPSPPRVNNTVFHECTILRDIEGLALGTVLPHVAVAVTLYGFDTSEGGFDCEATAYITD